MQPQYEDNDTQPFHREEPFRWRDFFEYHLLYRKWILGTLLFSLLAGILYVTMQSQQFEYKTVVLIKDPATRMAEISLFNDQAARRTNSRTSSRMATSRIGVRTANFVENEELVIRSGMLIERLVNSLKLHTSYYSREGLHDKELFRDKPYEVILDSAALNNLQSELTMKIVRIEKTYTLEGEYSGEEFSGKFSNLPAEFKTPAGLMKILSVNPVTDNYTFIRIVNPEILVTALVNGGIRTEINKNSDDIAIYYQSGNQLKAELVLKTLVQLYNQQAVEQSNESAENTADFLHDRIGILDRELNGLEVDLEHFKQQSEIYQFSDNTSLYIHEQAAYYNKLVEIDVQLQQTSQIRSEIEKDKTNRQLLTNTGNTSGSLAAIIAQYNQLILKRNQLLAGTSDRNPLVIRLNQELKSTRDAIVEQLQLNHKAMQLQWQEYTRQNNMYGHKLHDLPGQERAFTDVKRQQQVKEGIYLYLLKKMEETSLSLALVSNQARVLNAPMLNKQVSPEIPLTLSLFLLTGLLIPVSLINLRRIVNHTITNRREVEQLSAVPVIAELVHQENQNDHIDHSDNENPNAELLRLMRNKVQLLAGETGKMVMLVTSTQPGEGKTFVSMNLAISFSLTGKKVLLVGLDLRKPMLARHFNISAKEGLSSYLSGYTENCEQFISNMQYYPNLYILPGGLIPPNPNELLAGERFERLIESFKKTYDYIILDTAPVGAVSDTFLINRVAQLSLYVVRSGFTDKRNLQYLNRINREQTLNRVHLIINDTKAHSEKRYGYYQTYSN